MYDHLDACWWEIVLAHIRKEIRSAASQDAFCKADTRTLNMTCLFVEQHMSGTNHLYVITKKSAGQILGNRLAGLSFCRIFPPNHQGPGKLLELQCPVSGNWW